MQNEMNIPMPPCDIDAERAVLGAMIIDADGRAIATDALSAKDFYHTAHAQIFKTLVVADVNGQELDPLTLRHDLVAQHKWTESNARGAVNDLLDDVTSAAFIEEHIEAVRECSRLRLLIARLHESLRCCNEPGMTATRAAPEVEKHLNRALMQSVDARALRLGEIVPAELDYLHAIAKGGEPVGLTTGLSDLDELQGGMCAGEIMVVAAYTTVGKTTLSLNIALHLALAGHPVDIFSLEMTARQLARNLLVVRSGVPLQGVLRGLYISADNFAKLDEAGADLIDIPLWIDDRAGMTVGQLRARATFYQRRHGTQLIIVDYLQLIAGGGAERRDLEVGATMRALKVLAKDLEVPILLLVQLNRESTKETEPRLRHLRESGAIEQDADKVLLMWPDKDARPGEPVITIYTHLAKNRNGPCGKVPLTFFAPQLRFELQAKGDVHE